jgi:hypothetical protein
MWRAIAVHRRGTWPEEAALDTVTLAYVDRHRRRIRLVADCGDTLLLDLPRAHHLTEGDGSNSRAVVIYASAPLPSQYSKSKPPNRQTCCASPGISATGTYPCK